MKILHTSDWHLGRSLYGRKRYEEFEAFLDWLVKTIIKEKVDALLIAGDIFDTSTPSNRAQKLYYRLLCQVAASCCQHVIVIGGNHDSPSFLNAPKELLKALNVHVIGSMTESLEDEVIVLENNKKQEAIVCAVPYLRDKDVRTFEAGENIDDKNRKLVEGIKKHYSEVVKIAEQKRIKIIEKSSIENHQSKIPIIAMGHLFTAGGKTIDGDGVRELYVGSLAHVEASIFPTSIDYLALGHLHVPQIVASKDHIRYSGSPIPLRFGESNQQKSVVVIDITDINQLIKINKLDIPCFQKLISIKGSLETILSGLKELKENKDSAWLEIEYNADRYIENLRDVLDNEVSGSNMEIIRIKNKRIMNLAMDTISKNETLDDLNHEEVFSRCLDTNCLPGEDREALLNTYKEIVNDLHEDDINAE